MERLYLNKDGQFYDVTHKCKERAGDWFCYGVIALAAAYFGAHVLAAVIR